MNKFFFFYIVDSLGTWWSRGRIPHSLTWPGFDSWAGNQCSLWVVNSSPDKQKEEKVASGGESGVKTCARSNSWIRWSSVVTLNREQLKEQQHSVQWWSSIHPTGSAEFHSSPRFHQLIVCFSRLMCTFCLLEWNPAPTPGLYCPDIFRSHHPRQKKSEAHKHYHSRGHSHSRVLNLNLALMNF